MLTFSFYTCLTLFIIVCLFLILLILIQKGRGGGLASAFGGAGGNTAFGSKTGDVLTWATSIVFGIFLVLSVTSNLIGNKVHEAKTTPLGAIPASAVPQSNTPAKNGIPAPVGPQKIGQTSAPPLPVPEIPPASAPGR